MPIPSPVMIMCTTMSYAVYSLTFLRSTLTLTTWCFCRRHTSIQWQLSFIGLSCYRVDNCVVSMTSNWNTPRVQFDLAWSIEEIWWILTLWAIWGLCFTVVCNTMRWSYFPCLHHCSPFSEYIAEKDCKTDPNMSSVETVTGQPFLSSWYTSLVASAHDIVLACVVD